MYGTVELEDTGGQTTDNKNEKARNEVLTGLTHPISSNLQQCISVAVDRDTVRVSDVAVSLSSRIISSDRRTKDAPREELFDDGDGCSRVVFEISIVCHSPTEKLLTLIYSKRLRTLSRASFIFLV